MTGLLSLILVAGLTAAQQIGSPEPHPVLTTQVCTTEKGCEEQHTYVVIDALSHAITDIKTGASCITSSGQPNSTICATVEDCAKNCAVEGTNYASHGVSSSGDSLTMSQYLDVNGTWEEVSPRLYLLDAEARDYVDLKLLNQEISVTVDGSNLPCGMNGAFYLAAMDTTGGRSRLNPAGATYGTGYCDAQCGDDAWINGVANLAGKGSCCNELDILEMNARATALTLHACNITGLYECTGDACGSNGVCDKDGCGFNPYALGAHKFYGEGSGFKVNTREPFTVTTQFITSDNTASGDLVAVRRFYTQNGRKYENPNVSYNGSTINSITPSYCDVSDPTLEVEGGMTQMGKALEDGMVLIFAIWNDPSAYMNWLDAGTNGPCNATQGDPTFILKTDPGTSVTWSNIKWGDIGTTC